MLSRRRFIGCSTAALLAGACNVRAPSMALAGTLLAAFEDIRGDQYIGGLSLETLSVFGTRVPMRAHGCAVDPCDPERVVFFARRPGTEAFQLRLDELSVSTGFQTPAGRHLAGHGVFSTDGALLFVSEHDYQHARGVVTVRDARTFAVLEEIDTHGLEPHDIAWLPHGRMLVVANGGIMTHPRSSRRKLNLATMDPSLSLIDASRGACIEQWRLPDHRLSIRHLAVTTSGRTAVGLQFEGPQHELPAAVTAVYDPGAGLTLLSAPPTLKHAMGRYVSSVAVSDELLVAAAPHANALACWSLTSDTWHSLLPTTEAYGVSRLADGWFVVSQRDGRALLVDGYRRESHFLQIAGAERIRWHDHWVALADTHGHNRSHRS